jgi:hypothetical protein
MAAIENRLARHADDVGDATFGVLTAQSRERHFHEIAGPIACTPAVVGGVAGLVGGVATALATNCPVVDTGGTGDDSSPDGCCDADFTGPGFRFYDLLRYMRG